MRSVKGSKELFPPENVSIKNCPTISDITDYKEANNMMYPFMTLDDETEIVHSDLREDGSVVVYIEKADEKDCFHHMTLLLPGYE